MGRLAGHFNRARNAMDDLEHSVAKNVDRFVERVQQVNRRQEDVFLKKHGELDAQVTDIAEAEQDLEDFAKNERPGGQSGNAYTGTGGTNDGKD